MTETVKSNIREQHPEGAPRLTVCLDDSPRLGGLTRGIRDLAAALGTRILSLDSGRLPPSDDDEQHCLTRIRTGSGVLTSRHLRLSRRVTAVIDEAIADSELVVLHSLYRAHVPFIHKKCLQYGIPYWIVTHGMLDPWVVSRHGAWKRAWLMLHGHRCLKDATRVVVSTRAEWDKASPWLPGKNTTILPWPVDIPDAATLTADRAETLISLGIPVEDRILLSLTRYDSLKRPWHTIAAFVRAELPGWHLVMAGYDGDFNHKAAATETRRLGYDSVHLLGPVIGKDKRSLLLAADAFISLSWRENFGYSLVEAMANGIPFVAAPDHDIVSDLPNECRTWVLRDHSIEEAMRCVTQITSASPEQRKTIGARGQKWVEEHLSRNSFAQTARSLASYDIAEARRR